MTKPIVSDFEVISLDGYRIAYADIIKACKGEHFDMSLVGRDAQVVMTAVNSHPIDSRLEACFMLGRGDSYASHQSTQTLKGVSIGGPGRLSCNVSPKSLCVLLRRLLEDMTFCYDCECDASGCDGAAGYYLATTILSVLGFNESGHLTNQEGAN